MKHKGQHTKTMKGAVTMKEMYEKLEMEIIEFDSEDVITTSPQYPGEAYPIP